MNITLEQVLGQISDIKIAMQKGLHIGNIKAVMKEQKNVLVSDQHDFMTWTTLT